MDWKFYGGGPVYAQIKQLIREAVLAGEYPPGSKVPSVRDLAAQAQVNPNTMQRALQELEEEGLLHSNSTAGRFVTADETVLANMREELLAGLAAQFQEKCRRFGVSPQEAARLILPQTQ